MKTTDFFDRIKLLLAIVLLAAFHSEGYSQAGLNEKGQLDSDPGNVVDQNGAKGKGNARTVYGQIFVKSPVVATLSTTAASLISSATAASGGEITSGGGAAITSRGVVWSTSTTPTTALATKTSNGTGMGIFTSNITGLIPSTTYYVRSYAVNSVGTAYGNEISFTTSGPPPPPVGGNAICDNTRLTTVVEVTAASGKKWMDRNLGASRAATGLEDYEAYGCLYQWGRGNDGHASVIWTSSDYNPNPLQFAGTAANGTTTTLSATDDPGHSSFIIPPAGAPQDWRSPQNDNLWQGVNGINNPCPSGFRVPTITELETDTPNYAAVSETGVLKVAISGLRSSGAIYQQGINDYGIGHLYSSTVSGTSAYERSFRAPYILSSSEADRGTGYAVRCIKD